MPTYDYRCKLCGHEFELFQSMSASPRKKCPECGKQGLQRLIGAGAGFLFKGQGYYLTDYRSDSYKQAAEAEKKQGEPKADAKPEATPAKKPDKKSDSGTPKGGAGKGDAKPAA